MSPCSAALGEEGIKMRISSRSAFFGIALIVGSVSAVFASLSFNDVNPFYVMSRSSIENFGDTANSVAQAALSKLDEILQARADALTADMEDLLGAAQKSLTKEREAALSQLRETIEGEEDTFKTRAGDAFKGSVAEISRSAWYIVLALLILAGATIPYQIRIYRRFGTRTRIAVAAGQIAILSVVAAVFFNVKNANTLACNSFHDTYEDEIGNYWTAFANRHFLRAHASANALSNAATSCSYAHPGIWSLRTELNEDLAELYSDAMDFSLAKAADGPLDRLNDLWTKATTQGSGADDVAANASAAKTVIYWATAQNRQQEREAALESVKALGYAGSTSLPVAYSEVSSPNAHQRWFPLATESLHYLHLYLTRPLPAETVASEKDSNVASSVADLPEAYERFAGQLERQGYHATRLLVAYDNYASKVGKHFNSLYSNYLCMLYANQRSQWGIRDNYAQEILDSYRDENTGPFSLLGDNAFDGAITRIAALFDLHAIYVRALQYKGVHTDSVHRNGLGVPYVSGLNLGAPIPDYPKRVLPSPSSDQIAAAPSLKFLESASWPENGSLLKRRLTADLKTSISSQLKSLVQFETEFANNFSLGEHPDLIDKLMASFEGRVWKDMRSTELNLWCASPSSNAGSTGFSPAAEFLLGHFYYTSEHKDMSGESLKLLGPIWFLL